jgi:hypothetical protein
VGLQGVAQELRPVPLLQLELVLEQHLVQVQALQLVPELVQALLLGQPVHCDRCSRVRLLG